MATGERIKVVREARMRAIDDVATSVAISVDALKDIEAGKVEADPEQLWNLAQELEIELGFFLRTLPVVAIQSASPDSLSGLSDSERAAVIAQTQIWLERYLDIESFFPVEESPIFVNPEGFPMPIASAKDAANAATLLRAAWGLGRLPIGNVCDVLEQLGVRIGQIAGAGSFDAAAFYADDELLMPILVLNGELLGEKQRFAMARELAYFVLEGATQQTANHFAGSFLIPSEVLRQTFGSKRTNIELYELQLLKLRYGIAMRRMLARLASLRIIGEEQQNEWLGIFRDQEWVDNEPGIEGAPEIPARIIHMALRLQAEGEATMERTAEMLGIDAASWQSLLDFHNAQFTETEGEEEFAL